MISIIVFTNYLVNKSIFHNLILFSRTNCSFSDEDENIPYGSALDTSSEKNESCSDSESSVFSESDDSESTQSDPE